MVSAGRIPFLSLTAVRDEGPTDGAPIILLHGNPTWAYLYRHFIPKLTAAGHPAIAVNHLGFGRSDKPSDSAIYEIKRHADRLAVLLDALDLHDVTPVSRLSMSPRRGGASDRAGG